MPKAVLLSDHSLSNLRSHALTSGYISPTTAQGPYPTAGLSRFLRATADHIPISSWVDSRPQHIQAHDYEYITRKAWPIWSTEPRYRRTDLFFNNEPTLDYFFELAERLAVVSRATTRHSCAGLVLEAIGIKFITSPFFPLSVPKGPHYRAPQ